MYISGIRTRVIVSGKEHVRVPEATLVYRRHAPLSFACVTLADPSGSLFGSIGKGDDIQIHMGYRDQEADGWAGTIRRVVVSRPDQVTIHGAGIELPLMETRITKAWENEAPEQIVRYSVAASGLSVGNIDATGVVFPRFTAGDIPVWQVARQCEHTCARGFGKDMDTWDLWVDKEGLVHWGNSDEAGDIPIIATGNTLITHHPAADPTLELSRVETFLMPGFRRCGKFHITDTKRGIDAEFRARVVQHKIRQDHVRTLIWYGDEYGKY